VVHNMGISNETPGEKPLGHGPLPARLVWPDAILIKGERAGSGAYPGAIFILSRLGAAGREYPRLLRKLLLAYPERHEIFAGRHCPSLSARRAKSSTRGARGPVGVAQIPHDAIDSRVRRSIHGANGFAVRIGHCERNFLLRLFPQIVSEGQAVQLVLRYGETVPV